MAGKFLKRGAIIDTIKSEERMNAAQSEQEKSNITLMQSETGTPVAIAA